MNRLREESGLDPISEKGIEMLRSVRPTASSPLLKRRVWAALQESTIASPVRPAVLHAESLGGRRRAGGLHRDRRCHDRRPANRGADREVLGAPRWVGVGAAQPRSERTKPVRVVAEAAQGSGRGDAPRERCLRSAGQGRQPDAGLRELRRRRPRTLRCDRRGPFLSRRRRRESARRSGRRWLRSGAITTRITPRRCSTTSSKPILMACSARRLLCWRSRRPMPVAIAGAPRALRAPTSGSFRPADSSNWRNAISMRRTRACALSPRIRSRSAARSRTTNGVALSGAAPGGAPGACGSCARIARCAAPREDSGSASKVRLPVDLMSRSDRCRILCADTRFD